MTQKEAYPTSHYSKSKCAAEELYLKFRAVSGVSSIFHPQLLFSLHASLICCQLTPKLVLQSCEFGVWLSLALSPQKWGVLKVNFWHPMHAHTPKSCCVFVKIFEFQFCKSKLVVAYLRKGRDLSLCSINTGVTMSRTNYGNGSVCAWCLHLLINLTDNTD